MFSWKRRNKSQFLWDWLWCCTLQHWINAIGLTQSLLCVHVCVLNGGKRFNFQIMISKLNQVDMKTICSRQFKVLLCAFRVKRSGNSQYTKCFAAWSTGNTTFFDSISLPNRWYYSWDFYTRLFHTFYAILHIANDLQHKHRTIKVSKMLATLNITSDHNQMTTNYSMF